jgi:hypothetical protein
MSLNDMMSPSRRIERQKCDRLVLTNMGTSAAKPCARFSLAEVREAPGQFRGAFPGLIDVSTRAAKFSGANAYRLPPAAQTVRQNSITLS